MAEASTYKILEHRNAPTAIFSTRTETSLGVVRALHLGKRTDIAMVSFGDFVAADILSPAITVLDHNPRILARIAMKRLVVLMSGEEQESHGDTIVPLRIIARGSGELSVSALEVSA